MRLENFKFIVIFAGIIVTANLCAAIMGTRTVNLDIIGYHSPILCGIIPFCISFLLIDVFTNQYGFNNAKLLIRTIILCKIFLALVLYLSSKIPAANLTVEEIYFQTQISIIVRALFAGIIATLVAFYINCSIFSRMFVKFNGKLLWFRCIIATSIGELIYSIISNIIFFLYRLNIYEITLLTFNNYGFKFMFEVVTLPITYMLTYLLEKHETHVPIKYINFELKAIPRQKITL